MSGLALFPAPSTGGGGSGAGWTLKGASFTAVAGGRILADTSGGAWTLTLPASPHAGDSVAILDRKKSWADHNLTIARNGHNIESSASDLTANSAGASLELVYSGDATVGWRVVVTPSA